MDIDELQSKNRAQLARYPGDRQSRQPVHTVYGGAHSFRADTAVRLGELALASARQYARDAFDFARGVGFADVQGATAELQLRYARDAQELRSAYPSAWLACAVFERVQAKLAREAVEDFRIDFEEGLGARPDDEEDATARAAAEQVALGMQHETLPPFIGIRIKSFGLEWHARSSRTLQLFVDDLLERSGGKLPDNFVVTLPKVAHAAQPRALVRMLEQLERRHGLQSGSLRMELVIESTQALIGADGRSALPELLAACEGRCVGAHFGAYDYAASCNIAAAHQSLDHPMCDLARGMMLLACAGTGVFLSDGATLALPIGPFKGAGLNAAQLEHNRRTVHAAWQLSHRHIRHALRNGFHQGWDLHPAQLPVRYASCYAFYLEGFAQAVDRLRDVVDAVRGQSLINYVLRARDCGALDERDLAATGFLPEELGLRSFAEIVAARSCRLQPP